MGCATLLKRLFTASEHRLFLNSYLLLSYFLAMQSTQLKLLKFFQRCFSFYSSGIVLRRLFLIICQLDYVIIIEIYRTVSNCFLIVHWFTQKISDFIFGFCWLYAHCQCVKICNIPSAFPQPFVSVSACDIVKEKNNLCWFYVKKKK